MAKKKGAVISESTVISDQGLVSSDQEAGGEGYTVGQWAWMPQYMCKQCEFDTLELSVMEEHLLVAHGTRTPAHLHPSTDAQDGEGKPSPQPSPLQGEGDERGSGIFEIDLKEDQ